MTPTSVTSSKTRAEHPYDMTAYSLLREKITDVLDSLTARERKVLACASASPMATPDTL